MSTPSVSPEQLQQPLVFAPVYKDAIWGGTRIRERLQRESELPRIAESWEISDRDDGMSVVAAGPLAGQTLRSLVEQAGAALLGTRSAKGMRKRAGGLLAQLEHDRQQLEQRRQLAMAPRMAPQASKLS